MAAQLSEAELEEAHDFAVRLAVRAGEMLRQNARERIYSSWRQPLHPTSPSSSSHAQPNSEESDAAAAGIAGELKNGSSTDIVTAVDLSVERFVVGELKKRYCSSPSSTATRDVQVKWDVLAEEEYASKGDNTYRCGDVSAALPLPLLSLTPLAGVGALTLSQTPSLSLRPTLATLLSHARSAALTPFTHPLTHTLPPAVPSLTHLLPRNPKKKNPTWIVDPLDGTVNFTHLFLPNICISLGLAVAQQPVVGVVYAPLSGGGLGGGLGGPGGGLSGGAGGVGGGVGGTLWSSCKGKGAYMSWPALPPSSSPSCAHHGGAAAAASSSSSANNAAFEQSTSLRWLDAHAPGPRFFPSSSSSLSSSADSRNGAGLAPSHPTPYRLPLQPRPLPPAPAQPTSFPSTSSSTPSASTGTGASTAAASPLKGLLFVSEWGKDRKVQADSNLTRKAHTFFNLAARGAPAAASEEPPDAAPAKGTRTSPATSTSTTTTRTSSSSSAAAGLPLSASLSRLSLPGGEVHGLRSLGSSALDLVHCAAGSVDIMWEGAAWEWDVCAGLAILQEAGGLWTDGNAPPVPAEEGQNGAQKAQAQVQAQGQEGKGKGWDPRVRLPPASLGGRRFLCIRPATPGPLLLASEEEKEHARAEQERIAREVWKRLHLGGLDYHRVGAQYALHDQLGVAIV